MGLAEEIRHFVSEHYIKPAKERGETKLVVVSGSSWPNRLERQNASGLQCSERQQASKLVWCPPHSGDQVGQGRKR